MKAIVLEANYNVGLQANLSIQICREAFGMKLKVIQYVHLLNKGRWVQNDVIIKEWDFLIQRTEK